MSSYSCPDCKDGTLEATLREIEIDLAEGESIELINGRPYATSVRCDNGCSDSAPPEIPSLEELDRETCGVRGCGKPPGHEGRHRKNPGGGK